MSSVYLEILGEDEDVVEVDKNKLVDHVSQYVIDQTLEDGWCFSESERH